MISKTYSGQTELLSATIIDIEVDLSKGLHAFSIVGLATKAVDESKDRVAAAVKNSGFKLVKFYFGPKDLFTHCIIVAKKS